MDGEATLGCVGKGRTLRETTRRVGTRKTKSYSTRDMGLTFEEHE